MHIDLLQEKKIKWLFAGLTALGGFVGILIFLDQRKHNKVEREIFELDKQIKSLELEKLKNGNTK
jgi:hypothetical protein